jgi:hypothetical protein
LVLKSRILSSSRKAKFQARTQIKQGFDKTIHTP